MFKDGRAIVISGAMALALGRGLCGAASASAAPPAATVLGTLVGGGQLTGAATASVQAASLTDQIVLVTLTVDGVVRDRSNSGLLLLDSRREAERLGGGESASARDGCQQNHYAMR